MSDGLSRGVPPQRRPAARIETAATLPDGYTAFPVVGGGVHAGARSGDESLSLNAAPCGGAAAGALAELDVFLHSALLPRGSSEGGQSLLLSPQGVAGGVVEPGGAHSALVAVDQATSPAPELPASSAPAVPVPPPAPRQASAGLQAADAVPSVLPAVPSAVPPVSAAMPAAVPQQHSTVPATCAPSAGAGHALPPPTPPVASSPGVGAPPSGNSSAVRVTIKPDPAAPVASSFSVVTSADGSLKVRLPVATGCNRRFKLLVPETATWAFVVQHADEVFQALYKAHRPPNVHEQVIRVMLRRGPAGFGEHSYWSPAGEDTVSAALHQNGVLQCFVLAEVCVSRVSDASWASSTPSPTPANPKKRKLDDSSAPPTSKAARPSLFGGLVSSLTGADLAAFAAQPGLRPALHSTLFDNWVGARPQHLRPPLKDLLKDDQRLAAIGSLRAVLAHNRRTLAATGLMRDTHMVMRATTPADIIDWLQGVVVDNPILVMERLAGAFLKDLQLGLWAPPTVSVDDGTEEWAAAPHHVSRARRAGALVGILVALGALPADCVERLLGTATLT